MTTTKLQLIQDIADDLSLRKSGVATGGTATTVVAANYPFKTSRTDVNSSRFEGAEMYMTTSNWIGTPNPNDISIDAPSTGTLTVGNAYAGDTPAAADTFDIYLRGVSYTEIAAAVNRALRRLQYQTLAPLTLVPDGDMEAATTASWTSSNATLSKVTNSNVRRGTQSMRVLATGALGYAQSATIVVDPNYASTWFVQAPVRAQVGTARLIAYDVTNSAVIASVDWTQQGWGMIGINFTLPATCEALAFRLESVANTDDTYWDELLASPTGGSEIVLPTWVVRRDQILHVYQAPLVTTGRADFPQLHESGWTNVRGDESNPNNPWVLETGIISGPLYLSATRTYDELSTDAATTFCNRIWAVAAGKVELLKALKNRTPSQEGLYWRKQYDEARHELVLMNPDMLPEMVGNFGFDRPA